ncbi:MAG: bifunctional 4-hydroxy-2-oxoglutarate aldolase/2-dehydro-3-deoxy-phosphogluconate aldolase [Lachnospiraceae bacterium]|nr:bifunctional 4-hydroxy-2-oxoglutarate aldolase/2-dehydro-3-deoxy-phosphogluconate aldolase [Lachnospiraceae bacterium]
MNEVLEKIQKIGIVPVVALHRAEDAKPLAKALCLGGLPCAEVTFRTEAAEESIRIMREEFPDMLIGAGTVLTTEQVDLAVKAGAEFIVSPGFNRKVVEHCVKKGIAVTPGTSGPSDVEQAIELGLDVVKFFPAETAGGLKMIKSMSAPYTNMKFMPTGGISASNLNEYLAFPKILACGGSWMVKSELVDKGEFDEITRLTKEAIKLMLGLEILHVQFPKRDEKSGKVVEILDDLLSFGEERKVVTISANYLDRAKNYLEFRGLEFDLDSVEYQDGKMLSIALKDETAGYTILFVQK